MSISFSQVDFCIQQVEPCDSDSDGDGVCDDVDVCDGWDDNLLGTSCDDGDPCTVNDVYFDCQACQGTVEDTDNDGVCDADDGCPDDPDKIDPGICGCGVPEGTCGECIPETDYFPSSQLTYPGASSSVTTLNFTGLRTEISFTLSGLESITKGKPTMRYIDLVTVTYVDGSGYAHEKTYSGSDGSSFNVQIAEASESITVTLTNAIDNTVTISVDIGEVTYCAGSKSGSVSQDFELDQLKDMTFYPNPTTGRLNMQGLEGKVDIKVFSVQGKLLKSYFNVQHSVDISELPDGFYFIKISSENHLITNRSIIKR
jgi:hypothetical protein